MAGVLDEVGFVQPVVINRRTNKLLDGHMRVQIALSQGQPTVPAVYVDVSEEEESLILATLDPIGALAVPDANVLNDVLGNISSTNVDIMTFLDGLHTEVNQGVLKRAAGETGEGEDGDGNGEPGPKTKPTIRMLMQVQEIEVLEQAIMRTGAATRGEALVEICQYYIGSTVKVKARAGARE